MEQTLIWALTIIVILVIVVPYLIKFSRIQKESIQKHKESVRLGADKAIAQHPQINQVCFVQPPAYTSKSGLATIIRQR